MAGAQAATAADGERCTATEYKAPRRCTFAQWEADGVVIQQAARASYWWIGDWLRYGENRFGETSAQAVDLTGLELSTVTAARWVSERVAPSRRLPSLSWSHHREVAALEPDEQTRWLVKAEEEGWNRQQLREAVHGKPEPKAETSSIAALQSSFAKACDMRFGDETGGEVFSFVCEWSQRHAPGIVDLLL